MSTPAQMGKRDWNAALEQAHEANAELRRTFRRIMREGSPLVQALISQAVMTVADNDEALRQLEKIGRRAK